MSEENISEVSAAKQSTGTTAWYVIHTQAGYEKKVTEKIKRDISQEDLPVKQFVHNVLLHTKPVKDSKHGKERLVKCFPGYVLVEVVIDPLTQQMNSDAYWYVRNVRGVSGFLGDPHPVPLPQEDIDAILQEANNPDKKPIYLEKFKRGESVRITEGPFKHFIGTVEEVNEQKNKLKVMVMVFDRPAPVELDFLQVEKN